MMESAKQAMQVETITETGLGAPETLEATALEGLKVQFISLVPHPANKRSFLVMKAASLGEEGGVPFTVVEKQVQIIRKDAARKMIYGVVLAPNEVDDELDTITAEEIEKSAYAFMQGGRTQQIDTDHSTEAGAGFVAESWIVRAGDPLFAEEAPGTWVVGVKVTDETAWERIEKEDLLGFSVGGVARRRPVEVETVAKQTSSGRRPGGRTMIMKNLVGEDAQEPDPLTTVVKSEEESLADGFVRKVRSALGIEAPRATPSAVEKKQRVEIQEKKSDMSAAPGASTDGQEGSAEKRIIVEIQEKKSDMAGATPEEAFATLVEALELISADTEIADKPAAALEMVAAFEAAMEAQQGAVEKAQRAAEEAVAGAVEKAVAPLAKQIGALQAELETLSGQHAGRQTRLGTPRTVEKAANGKGYRGLRIKL